MCLAGRNALAYSTELLIFTLKITSVNVVKLLSFIAAAAATAAAAALAAAVAAAATAAKATDFSNLFYPSLTLD
jgi:hypothetical protein